MSKQHKQEPSSFLSTAGLNPFRNPARDAQRRGMERILMSTGPGFDRDAINKQFMSIFGEDAKPFEQTPKHK